MIPPTSTTGTTAMSATPAQTYQKLKDLLAARPDLARRLDGVKEVNAASQVLAEIAAGAGLAISAAEIAAQIQHTQQSDGRPDGELDDAMLESVAGGGGSPWCWMTDGCYCFFTK